MSNLSINMSSMRRSLTSEVRSEGRMSIGSVSTISTIENDEKELAALITNSKCLHIVRCILERIEGVS